jgi:multiple sugar transport system substrate-binding protein
VFPEPSGSFAKAAAECSKASNGEYSITIHALPTAADGQRQEMARRLAAGDNSLDILGLDVTWTPEFAEANWIAPFPDSVRSKIEKGTLKPMIETSTWNGKLYSAPLNTNTQLLWYRSDLVKKPPKTWAEMIKMSQDLAKQGKPHYIEAQGAEYEGYTVWFNTLVASAGGQIVSNDGSKVELTKNNAGEKALQVIHDMVAAGAADPSLSVFMEDQGRLAFEAGTAAFEVNYPYVYPSAQADVPKIYKVMKWAPYPRVDANEPSHVTIGGIDLAVGKSSLYKKQAFDAITCLRSAGHEVTNAVAGGLPPVLTSVYKKKSFQKTYPAWKDILASLKSASIRAKTPAYQSVSLQVSYTLSPPEGIAPQSDIKVLTSRINDAINSKGLVP